MSDPKHLSDEELLALFIPPKVAKEFGNLLLKDPGELALLKGLDRSVRVKILALRELMVRMGEPHRREGNFLVRSGTDAYSLFSHLRHADQETVSAAFLTTRNRVICVREIFRGTISSSPASPREILREALCANAAKLLVAHNHPSGDSEPSEEDIYFTAQLEWSAKAVGIPLVDHLIIGNGGKGDGYFSFAEAKLLGRRVGALEKNLLNRVRDDPYRKT
jgi:DNA repair protein RadC